MTADDLGTSPGTSAGIVQAHARGVVTSTSLMVRSPHAEHGAGLAQEHPALAVGLHLDLTSQFAAPLDRSDVIALRRELEAQLALFVEIMGRAPTHIDGHHHVHLQDDVRSHARELAELVGVHLRGIGPARFCGSFDARPSGSGPADPELVTVAALLAIVDGLEPGIHELMCHPGMPDPELRSSYAEPRAWELATLTDRALAGALQDRGVRLASFADFAGR